MSQHRDGEKLCGVPEGGNNMSDLEFYDPDYCDGNPCPRDCAHCPIADKIISALSKMEEKEEE